MAASDDIHRAHSLLANADRVLIGAGAGLSTAAGLAYSGERFQRYFAPFVERYGMTDMYSAGFYPFPTQEDKWAYWSQHIWVNRFEPGATPLYRRLFEWARKRDYFVITTNVDAQFELAGFDPQRIFATQGDYGYLQCARGCHERIYPVKELMQKWRADLGAHPDGTLARTQLSDPALVPACPVCGGRMETHLRADSFFVETDEWRAAQQRYRTFVEEMRGSCTVLLELGVGWNTPVWIRYPFEQMTRLLGSDQAPLVRINYDAATADASGIPGAAGLAGDIAEIWDDLGL